MSSLRREDRTGLMDWVQGRERRCALLGAVTIAFSSILVRLSHASPSTAAIFRCLYALPVLAGLAALESRRLGRRSWRERRASLAAGVFFAADLLLWHHSIGDVGAGLATVLANVQVVLVPLVAWAVLAEAPGRRILIALPVSLAGVLLISGVIEQGAYGHNPARGTLFGLGAGVAYVGFLLLLRQGTDVRRPAGPLCDATAVAALLCAAAGLVIGDARFIPSWPGAGWLVLLALTSQVFGWLLITSSLPRLPAALTSLLLTVQPVGSVGLAALIFAESPSLPQFAGVGLVLAALLAASGSAPPRRAVTRGQIAGLNVRPGPVQILDDAADVHPVGPERRTPEDENHRPPSRDPHPADHVGRTPGADPAPPPAA